MELMSENQGPPEYREAMPSTRGGRRVRWAIYLALFAAGLAYWAFCAAGAEPARAWRTALIDFVFFAPLMIGMVCWSATELMCNGNWSGASERWALAGLGAWPVSLILYALLAAGREHWAPWANGHTTQGFWLDPAFVLVRDFAGLAVLLVLAWWYVRLRRRSLRPATLGGWFMTAYAVVMTLLAFDLVMALDPRWYSTLFGGYFLMTGMYAAVAAWTLAAIFSGAAGVNQRHDLGKLVVALSLVSTYMMFSQLLPIWYENLPQEARFVVPRLRLGPWKYVASALLVTIYLGPLVILLSRRSKRSRPFLAAFCIVMLAGLWAERWWLVAPTAGGAFELGLVEASLTVSMAAGSMLGIEWLGRRLPDEIFQKVCQERSKE